MVTQRDWTHAIRESFDETGNFLSSPSQGLRSRNMLWSDGVQGYLKQGGRYAFGYIQAFVELVGSDGLSIPVQGSRLNVNDSIDGARIRRQFAVLTTTTETVILTVDAFQYVHLTGYSIHNRDPATAQTVDILSKPSGAGTVIWKVYVPPLASREHSFTRPGVRGTSQENISAKLSAVPATVDVIVNLHGFVDTD